ncbi:DEAD/DEAH box helicase [Nannocystis sp.]|uniref:Lhr family helicase n=1 Tax=Nannocystis sp. TaxID=1962667 RepID=UPI0025F8D1CB|nr:DEAD/DEAH box helicase [Nannocystis sp.]
MSRPAPGDRGDALALFHAPVQRWFRGALGEPTSAQARAWPAIAAGRSTLLLAPTGSGKTLAAFLAGLDRLMFSPEPAAADRCRLLYVSPLKALAVDVERNLRAPLAGIAAAAVELGAAHRVPSLGVRSGDTSMVERARLVRQPPDILITTPESLYLMLTSGARALLASVDAIVIDEIHALVASKRGAHLFVSLERLEALRRAARPGVAAAQRIGLSATQRPLDEVARLLGGAELDAEGLMIPRPVEIVDAGARKLWDLRVEMPAIEQARAQVSGDRSEGTGAKGQVRKGRRSAAAGSIWPVIYPRLVALIRGHRSTMIFCNSRRLAERLAAAINEAAGEELALAHHGSVARERRQMIEDRLKAGELPAIVATSSLELGIDIGALDLVIQIEAPPSVAAGIQRIGRAGHQVGAVSRGVLMPKFRGDLLACAAATPQMRAGEVEESRYPRCPLDVLAQQIVATLAMEPWHIDALYAMLRGAAPFAELPRAAFEGVLDMLAGRYPSDEFAELRPRIVWDRVTGQLRAREGARMLAVLSGGTIPDRGLFGVFLLGEAGTPGRRVGELDEEMVFESRVGEVFVLGASSWRIEAITADRVLVSPAPGQPGKMPFWHGDNPGRPFAFGQAIGQLARELLAAGDASAQTRLREQHGLDAGAASQLLAYLREQAAATGELPCDRTLVIERNLDELGDWRVCVLSPFGARVHAPWALAIAARLRAERGIEALALWSDDGIVLRFPAADAPPEVAMLLIDPDEIEARVVACLGATAVFAARFRESAARALLLPRRLPGKRSPLWAQRQRSADLLAVASRHPAFPIVLETYRECLRDVFDLPALVVLLRRIAARELRVQVVDTRVASPFAAALMFAYVANFIYEGDAPLAERRAQALAVDASQLRALLGEASLRELLDAAAIVEAEQGLQRLDGARAASSADGLHELLLSLGPLSSEACAARSRPQEAAAGWLSELAREGRIVAVVIAGGVRHAAIEDASRLRDALGVSLPDDLPPTLRAAVDDPLGDVVARHARTHGPFTAAAAALALGLGVAVVESVLQRLAGEDRVLAGEFTPGGQGREWCDVKVLRGLKQRSLARLRRAVEPVSAATLGRFLPHWQGVTRPRRGPEALLAVVAQLQGAPLLASALDTEILPARVVDYRPEDLDALCAAGELRWCGLEAVGASDGRIALYLADDWPLLARPPRPATGELAQRLRGLLAARGASFFADLASATGAFPADLLAALWQLVWAGELGNDTLSPLRKIVHGSASDHRRRAPPQGLFRARRLGPPGSEGRWSLLPYLAPETGPSQEPGAGQMVPGTGLMGQVAQDRSQAPGAGQMARGTGPSGQVAQDRSQAPGAIDMADGTGDSPSATARAAALARALLDRHGVLTREALQAEDVAGGFAAVYPVLGAMEAAGQLRRGYFVAGLGGAQFALPGADERLRSLREPGERPEICVLASTDPANAYGAALPWPERAGARLARAAHTRVVLIDGVLAAYVGKDARTLWTFLPDADSERNQFAAALARALAGLVGGPRRTLVIAQIDGVDAQRSPLAPTLERAGFSMTSQGLFIRARDDA